jgi:hypothetical protein
VVELKAPLLSVEKVIVPVGVTAVPPSVSVTVAVHVLPSLTAIEEGEHPRATEVVRVVAVRANADAVLVA